MPKNAQNSEQRDLEFPRCTIVVMAYNEGKTISDVVQEIAGEMENFGQSWEVLIVDDGSEDDTREVCAALVARHAGVRAIHHAGNKGLGEVYRTGFESARGEWLSFMPGDGQIPASDLRGFLEKMPENDLVLGLIPHRPCPLYVKALSAAERLLYRVLFGGMPAFQGIMMVRTARLRELRLASRGRGWTILMEMILKGHRNGWVIDHAPTGLRDRAFGESKVNNVRTVVSNVVQMVRLRKELTRL